MEIVIDLDIKNKEDLYDKYNEKKVNKEIIDYLINQAAPFYNHGKFVIKINNKTKEDIDVKRLIVEGLNREMDKNLIKHYRNNMSQVYYFIMGIITLFVATILPDGIMNEIFLIGGWVFIWALIEMEIFGEMEGRKRRKVIKKLLNGKIIEDKK